MRAVQTDHNFPLLGVMKGQAHIAGDLITNLFRATTRGATPKNNWITDGLYDLIGFVSSGPCFWEMLIGYK
jgi:hypothetical protein